MRTLRVSLILCLAVAIGAGCENGRSKLDNLPAAPPTTAAPGQPQAAAEAAAPGDHSGSVEERLRRLEDTNAKNAEALDFLNKVYAQQKQQMAQQEREEPAPDAIFAVNIAEDVKAGKVEGPANAPVTIVKAFDFA